jgi:amicoumacin kinase
LPVKRNATAVKQAAWLFEIEESRLVPAAGGHVSDVYTFRKDHHDLVLRITPPDGDMGVDAMRAALAWIGFLSDHEGPVCRPLRSRNGEALEQIEDGSNRFLVTAFERAPGVLAEELPSDQWNDDLYASLGRATGRMHALSRTYLPADPALVRPAWDRISTCYNPDGSQVASQPEVARMLSDHHAHVRSLPRSEDDYGLIHADLHGGNFFVDPGNLAVTILDFDDCCYGWYAMDVAMAVFDMLVVQNPQDPPSFARAFLQSYWHGYRAEHHLTPFLVEQIPHFLKLLEIGVYAGVHSRHDPHDTESWIGRFMRNRRERIEGGVPYVDILFGEILAAD